MKKIKIKGTKISPKLGAGSHHLNALQKHQGIVKPTMAKKLTKTEKWIKKRNLGHLKAGNEIG